MFVARWIPIKVNPSRRIIIAACGPIRVGICVLELDLQIACSVTALLLRPDVCSAPALAIAFAALEVE